MSGSNTSAWQFSRKVMLPIGLAIAVTIGTVIGFVAWSIGRTDAHALDRQQRLLEQALADQIEAVPLGQADLAVWDDALTAVDDRDLAWLNENMGASAFEYYGQSRLYLIDSRGKPIYAMRDGGQVPAKAFDSVASQIAPLLDQLRELDSLAAIDAYNNGVGDAPPFALDLMQVEGRPAIVSVMPMLSESWDAAVPVGEEPIYVAMTMLDDALAQTLEAQYLFHNARFTAENSPADGETALPIKDKAGNPVAWFTWIPDRPGAGILNDTLPALIGALLVAGSIIGLLLRNLHRASSQLQAERAEAQHRALHDPLTGLGNRTLFRDRLGEALRTMPRGEPRLALLALDLDRFKQVNDTMGHEGGDELLRQVSARLTSLLGPKETLVRLGGDEFAIVQPGISSRDEPAALAAKAIAALAQPFLISGRIAEIGVSIGIATAPDGAQTEAELASFADDALYRAKAGGRSRYCLHGAKNEDDGSPAQLEQRVRDAFSRTTSVA